MVKTTKKRITKAAPVVSDDYDDEDEDDYGEERGSAYMADPKANSKGTIWYILGGLAVLIVGIVIAFFILKADKKTTKPVKQGGGQGEEAAAAPTAQDAKEAEAKALMDDIRYETGIMGGKRDPNTGKRGVATIERIEKVLKMYNELQTTYGDSQLVQGRQSTIKSGIAKWEKKLAVLKDFNNMSLDSPKSDDAGKGDGNETKR